MSRGPEVPFPETRAFRGGGRGGATVVWMCSIPLSGACRMGKAAGFMSHVF